MELINKYIDINKTNFIDRIETAPEIWKFNINKYQDDNSIDKLLQVSFIALKVSISVES